MQGPAGLQCRMLPRSTEATTVFDYQKDSLIFCDLKIGKCLAPAWPVLPARRRRWGHRRYRRPSAARHYTHSVHEVSLKFSRRAPARGPMPKLFGYHRRTIGGLRPNTSPYRRSAVGEERMRRSDPSPDRMRRPLSPPSGRGWET